MTTTIKALSDGLSGELQVNGAPALRYGADTSGQMPGFRNRIINGDMRIDQRNAGAAVTPSGTGALYTLDRFYSFATVGSKLTTQQVAAPSGFAGFAYAAKLTVASAYTPAAGDIFAYNQAVEGYNMADFAWGTSNAKPVTLSFYAQSSIAGTYSVCILNAAATRSYVTTYTLSANTPAKISITIPGETSGVWSNTTGTGLYLINGLGVGATYQTSTLNTWLTGNYQFASTATQWITNAGATFYITGIQLEAGSIATPFEHRPYGTELALCQRYYETGAFGYNGSYQTAGSSVTFFSNFLVQKRATPTMTAVSATSTNLTSPALNSGSATSFSYGGLATATGVVVYTGTYTAVIEL